MFSAVHVFAAVVIALLPLGKQPLGHVLPACGMCPCERVLEVVALGSVSGAAISRRALLRAAAAEESPRGATDEAYPRESVGRFLKTLKRAIPWAAALALVAALGVVVATCWLRKGVLLQNLTVGRGRGSNRKGRDHSKAAARYVAKLEERRAAKRDEEPDR